MRSSFIVCASFVALALAAGSASAATTVNNSKSNISEKGAGGATVDFDKKGGSGTAAPARGSERYDPYRTFKSKGSGDEECPPNCLKTGASAREAFHHDAPGSRKTKPNTGVLMQQGRVQTDSDWNSKGGKPDTKHREGGDPSSPHHSHLHGSTAIQTPSN